MSNSWKVLGLGCMSDDFLNRVREVRSEIQPPMALGDALRRIDERVLVPFRCPLGHLEAQNFYDSIFNVGLWDKLQQIQRMGTFAAITDGLRHDEYCRLIGLACTDPWRGQGQVAVGFRHKLRANPAEAARNSGFLIDDEMTAKIVKGMTNSVMDLMDKIADDWEIITFFNTTERDRYPRFDNVFPQFPPGWVKRAI